MISILIFTSFISLQCLRSDSLESMGDVSTSLNNPPYIPAAGDVGSLLNPQQMPCNTYNNGSQSTAAQNSHVNVNTSSGNSNHNGTNNSSTNNTNNNSLHLSNNSSNSNNNNTNPMQSNLHSQHQQGHLNHAQDLMANLQQHIKQDYDLTTL